MLMDICILIVYWMSFHHHAHRNYENNGRCKCVDDWYIYICILLFYSVHCFSCPMGRGTHTHTTHTHRYLSISQVERLWWCLCLHIFILLYARISPEWKKQHYQINMLLRNAHTPTRKWDSSRHTTSVDLHTHTHTHTVLSTPSTGAPKRIA